MKEIGNKIENSKGVILTGLLSFIIVGTFILCMYASGNISFNKSSKPVSSINIPSNFSSDHIPEIEGYHKVTSYNVLLNGVNVIISRNNSTNNVTDIMKIPDSDDCIDYPSEHVSEINGKLGVSDEIVTASSFTLTKHGDNNFTYSPLRYNNSDTRCLNLTRPTSLNRYHLQLTGRNSGYFSIDNLDSTGKNNLHYHALDSTFTSGYINFDGTNFNAVDSLANTRMYVDTYSLLNAFGEEYLYYSSYISPIGRCGIYYPIAKQYLLSLDSSYVEYFSISTNAHISELRQRYESWAKSNKDPSPYFL